MVKEMLNGSTAKWIAAMVVVVLASCGAVYQHVEAKSQIRMNSRAIRDHTEEVTDDLKSLQALIERLSTVQERQGRLLAAVAEKVGVDQSRSSP